MNTNGSSANIIANIIGETNVSRVITLNPRIRGDAFERGDIDTIKIESQGMGAPVSVKLVSDGKFVAPDWKINKIEVVDTQNGASKIWTGEFEFDEDEGRLDVVVAMWSDSSRFARGVCQIKFS